MNFENHSNIISGHVRSRGALNAAIIIPEHCRQILPTNPDDNSQSTINWGRYDPPPTHPKPPNILHTTVRHEKFKDSQWLVLHEME